LPALDDTSGFAIVYDDNPGQNQFSFYTLGTITLEEPDTLPVEIQRLQRFDFYNIERSALTKSTKQFPTYLYENNELFVNPKTITANIKASFIRKPLDIKWNFTQGNVGQYIYTSTGSQNFELLPSEQVNVILRILQYSGIIIRDPQIVQAASAEIQQNDINAKS
jgi:hypothetical protein